MSDVKVIKDCGGSAFPNEGGDNSELRPDPGMSTREYAAIKLRVPDSGTDWLDEMIVQSLRLEIAAKAMQAIIGCYKNTLLGVRNFDDSHDFSTFARDIAIDKNGQTSENDGCNEIAKDSYAFADAMLAARKEAPDGNRD